MRRWIRTAAIAFVTAQVLGAAPAQATTFAPLTIEQLTDGSLYVVEGKVLEVWTELDAERMLVWTRARVEVSRTYKGPDSPTELVVDSLGGAYGDFQVSVPAMAVFSVDEDVFLFLDQLGSGRLVPASKFLGKYTVRRAPGEIDRYVRQWEGKVGEVYDARFLPHPEPSARLSLSELEQRVEDRVTSGWDGVPIPGVSAARLSEINAVRAAGRTP
jgi:hypothetical protein